MAEMIKKKPWIKASWAIMFKIIRFIWKTKRSNEVADDPEDEDTPNTAESEG